MPSVTSTRRVGLRLKFFERFTPELRIRRNDKDAVGRLQFCRKLAQIGYRTDNSAIIDEITDLEGAENQQHDAGSNVGQCPLKGRADCQAGCADNGQETGPLNAELLKHREESEDNNRVADHAPKKPLEHYVDLFDLASAFWVTRRAHPATIQPRIRITSAPMTSMP